MVGKKSLPGRGGKGSSCPNRQVLAMSGGGREVKEGWLVGAEWHGYQTRHGNKNMSRRLTHGRAGAKACCNVPTHAMFQPASPFSLSLSVVAAVCKGMGEWCVQVRVWRSRRVRVCGFVEARPPCFHPAMLLCWGGWGYLMTTER